MVVCGDGRGVVDKDFVEMIFVNVQEVLWFFGDVVKEEDDLQIIQKFEYDSYWIYFYILLVEVKVVVFEVKVIIDVNVEYGVYKIFVGFEGIFGDWMKDCEDEFFMFGLQDFRLKQLKVLVVQVLVDGFDVWCV